MSHRTDPDRLGLLAVKSALLLFLLFFGLLITSAPGLAEDAEEADWQALRSGGHAILMRHALAPGTGDPPGFSLGDCWTQRNLSAEGRQQAEAIGTRLRANGIKKANVYSSQWCRCLDTAKRLKLGEIQEQPFLNSFFGHPERREEQTIALKRWLLEQPLDVPPILVTHQVNIKAMTGRPAASGEMVVLKRQESGDFTFAFSIKPE